MNCKLGIEFMNNTLVKLLTISAVSLGAINVNCAKVEAVPNCVKPVQFDGRISCNFRKSRAQGEIDQESLKALYKACKEKTGTDLYTNSRITASEAVDSLNRGNMLSAKIESNTPTSPNSSTMTNTVTSETHAINNSNTGGTDVDNISSKIEFTPSASDNTGTVVADVNYSGLASNQARSDAAQHKVATLSLKATPAAVSGTENTVLFDNIYKKSSDTNWKLYEKHENLDKLSGSKMQMDISGDLAARFNLPGGGSIRFGVKGDLPLVNKTIPITYADTDTKNQSSNTTNTDSQKLSYDFTYKWGVGVVLSFIVYCTEKIGLEGGVSYMWYKGTFAPSASASSNNNNNNNTSNTNNDLKLSDKFEWKANGISFFANVCFDITNNVYAFVGCGYTPAMNIANSASSDDKATVKLPIRTTFHKGFSGTAGFGFKL
ncbi:MAG: hypothetical protein IJU54_01880 [Alphaproteobacteria bacterium]|nr:hypothetical protein [Alphaproteobacteria bacterium]